MRIDLLDNQHLIVVLPGGDELYLSDVSGSTTIRHYTGNRANCSFHIPKPLSIDPPPESDSTTQQQEMPPAAVEEDQARLFF